MITEVFVSIDGLNYNKLDLQTAESIPMRYTFKDTQDISKIFSPYSLGFTLQATPNNLLFLGFFGNTDVVRTTDLRKLKCKLYVNSLLNQTGLLKLEKVTYKNGKPSIITASFASSLTNLRDLIGDDNLASLGSVSIPYSPKDVTDNLQGSKVENFQGIGINYITPLASINRVWNYVANETGDPIDSFTIQINELRPAIKLKSILDLIKRKYNLLIASPLELRTEFFDAYIWCMAKSLPTAEIKFLQLSSSFGMRVRTGAANVMVWTNLFSSQNSTIFVNFTLSEVDFTYKIVKFCPEFTERELLTRHIITLNGINYLGDVENTIVTLNLIKKGQTFATVTQTFKITQPNEVLSLIISDSLLINNEIEYFINFQVSSPISWAAANTKIAFSRFGNNYPFYDIYNETLFSNNFAFMGVNTIDIIKALPEIKIIDFLQSYLKSFNIAILDVTPDDDSLYWFTPQDIIANKKEVTYTADISDVEKTPQDEFNFYTFKHFDSKFKSNVDYKIATNGLDYGKVSFPEIRPKNAQEYIIETKFTIIPPVKLLGTNDIETFYGFNSDAPVNGIYKPNFDEMVLFYSHGNKPLNRTFRVQSSLLNGNLITENITSYIKCLPYTSDNKSFAFSVLVNDNAAFRDNLFSRYYAEIISRYINQNVMIHDYDVTLNANELRDFRLENDIIIGENRFSIVDSTIDVTTGKAKLKLLNY